jgi:predicted PhzF superfamily epimerase YddE/YHI9
MATQSLSFVTLDVFTGSPYEGNPLAIVMIPPDREVNDMKLQQIAREFNLSETVFLYLNRGSDEDTKDDPPASADPSETVLEWKIRIFMTDCELPFAGHPTVGAAVYALTCLNNVGATRARFHCPAGVIDIQFDPAMCTAKMSIPHAVHLHTEAKHTIEENATRLDRQCTDQKGPSLQSSCRNEFPECRVGLSASTGCHHDYSDKANPQVGRWLGSWILCNVVLCQDWQRSSPD